MKDIKFSETIMGKITIKALMNWNNLSKEEAIEKVNVEYGNAENARNNVTYGSELSSIEGIKKVVGLNENEKDQLVKEMNTKARISSELAKKIKEKMGNNSPEKAILEILSEVHDNWVKDNSNKFEARPKNYQFVPLEMLPFNEVESDLIFLQEILTGCGVDVNKNKLKKVFRQKQIDFFEKNKITSYENLIEFLREGKFYDKLKGLKTNKGEKTEKSQLITDILKEDRILQLMAWQIGVNLFKQLEGNKIKMLKVLKGLDAVSLDELHSGSRAYHCCRKIIEDKYNKKEKYWGSTRVEKRCFKNSYKILRKHKIREVNGFKIRNERREAIRYHFRALDHSQTEFYAGEDAFRRIIDEAAQIIVKGQPKYRKAYDNIIELANRLNGKAYVYNQGEGSEEQEV